MDISILAYMYKNADYTSCTRNPLAHAIIVKSQKFEVFLSVNHVTINGEDFSFDNPYTARVFADDLKKAAACCYDHTIVRTITLLPYKSKFAKQKNV